MEKASRCERSTYTCSSMVMMKPLYRLAELAICADPDRDNPTNITSPNKSPKWFPILSHIPISSQGKPEVGGHQVICGGCSHQGVLTIS